MPMRDDYTPATRGDSAAEFKVRNPDWVAWPELASASAMRAALDNVAEQNPGAMSPEVLRAYRQALTAARSTEQVVGAATAYESVTPSGDKLRAVAESILTREQNQASGAYKGPTQIIIPGAGDVTTDAGQSRLLVGIAGAVAVVGLGVWAYRKAALFFLGAR